MEIKSDCRSPSSCSGQDLQRGTSLFAADPWRLHASEGAFRRWPGRLLPLWEKHQNSSFLRLECRQVWNAVPSLGCLPPQPANRNLQSIIGDRVSLEKISLQFDSRTLLCTVMRPARSGCLQAPLLCPFPLETSPVSSAFRKRHMACSVFSFGHCISHYLTPLC